MKKQKGITLIALVITIIVMLILVGVSVTVALNGGLFSTAKEAADGTQIAVDAEKTLDNGRVKVDGIWYDSIEDYINKNPSKNQTEEPTEGEQLAEGWHQDGNVIKYVDANGTVTTTLRVGDKVAYDETKAGTVTVSTANMEWRALGVNEEGQVELISTIPTTEKVGLIGKDGYLNAITLLNTACSTYGQGAGAASARSLTAEDINKLGNYDPTTYSGYGTKYTYQYDPTDATVKGILSSNYTEDMTNSNWKDTGYTEFYSADWIISSSNVGPYELETTNYSYTVADQVKITDPVDMATLITNGEGGTRCVYQWLASLSLYLSDYSATFSIGCLDHLSRLTYIDQFYSSAVEVSDNMSVRPVVSLESNIQLTENAEGVFEIK